ncbi:MAG: hypothetical protein HY741_27820 [Chloroflexi bacterium]|nr:hypothetical protein [Chloroflexota bacterium]
MLNLKPHAPIRRFDVFAEYNRLKALQEGQSAAQAKGYGLWLAKVVAAQKFGRLPKPEREKERGREEEKEREKKERKKKWHDLSGIPQTDKLFEKEIVNRMGKSFYQKVFAPALKEEFDNGADYRDIRDSIRREWKPETGS